MRYLPESTNYSLIAILLSAFVVAGPKVTQAQCNEQYRVTGESLSNIAEGKVIRMLGLPMANAGDVNGDGFDDIVAGAPHSQADTLNNFEGRIYVFSGMDGSIIHDILPPFGVTEIGLAVAGAGDVNGDGLADIIASGQASSISAALVLSGADASIIYQFSRDDLGFAPTSVAGGADVNLDGVPDFIIGGRHSGMAQVRSGSDGTVIYDLFPGTGAGHSPQSVAWGGDINNDGYPDILFHNATTKIDSETRIGIVHIFSGADGSELRRLTIDPVHGGVSAFGVGDFNSDGFDDFVAPGSSGSGSTEVSIYSGADASILQTFNIDGTQFVYISSVLPAGDVDNDGTTDFWLGGGGWDSRAALISGATGGALAVYSDLERLAWTLYGESGSRVIPLNDAGESGQIRFAMAVTTPRETSASPSGGVSIQSYSIGQCCCWKAGDMNHDNSTNIGDVTFGIKNIFSGGGSPPCVSESDVTGDGLMNIADVVGIIDHIFKGTSIVGCLD